jgi:cell division septation protein DedD
VASALGVTRSAEAAEAADLPLRLTWDAPHECPRADSVVRRVRELLSETPTEGPVVDATAKIRALGDGRSELSLITEVGGARGTKTVSAGSCGALAEAAAVFLALTIDSSNGGTVDAVGAPPLPARPSTIEPSAETPRASVPSPSTSATETTPSPSSSPSIAPSNDRAASASTASAHARSSGVRLGIGTSGVFDVATLPSPAPGLAFDVHLRTERFRVGGLATLWHTQSETFERGTGAGASFRMLSAGIFGCYVVPVDRFAFGPCMNAEATLVEVAGVSIRNPMSSRAAWPTLGAGPLASVRLMPWLELFARADVLASIGASEVSLATAAGRVSLYDPGVFSARFALGLHAIVP